MKYVYMVGDHDEYGSEHCYATLRRDMVVDLIRDKYCRGNDDFWKHYKERTLALLKRDDDDLSRSQAGHSIADGWGGPQLFVIPLEYDL